MRYINALILLILVIFSTIGITTAEETAKERGLYIYDLANRISSESEFGLNAYLWKVDVKTHYEIVVVFSDKKMTVEEMQKWFNDNGVGKKTKDNGLALFIFPDNTVYGMIGKGNDRIAVPYLTTQGKKTLSGLDKEPVLAVLAFVNGVSKKIDEPTVLQQGYGIGKTILINLDVIILGFLFVSFIIVLYKQKDGFQLDDLKIPFGLSIILIIFICVTLLASYGETVHREYGEITGVDKSSYRFTETHSYPCGKSTCYYTDHHTMYTNIVNSTSYDFKVYRYQFSSRDSQSSWNVNIGDKTTMGITNKLELSWLSTGIDDNSGGKTDRYGTWIDTKY